MMTPPTIACFYTGSGIAYGMETIDVTMSTMSHDHPELFTDVDFEKFMKFARLVMSRKFYKMLNVPRLMGVDTTNLESTISTINEVVISNLTLSSIQMGIIKTYLREYGVSDMFHGKLECLDGPDTGVYLSNCSNRLLIRYMGVVLRIYDMVMENVDSKDSDLDFGIRVNDWFADLIEKYSVVYMLKPSEEMIAANIFCTVLIYDTLAECFAKCDCNAVKFALHLADYIASVDKEQTWPASSESVDVLLAQIQDFEKFKE